MISIINIIVNTNSVHAWSTCLLSVCLCSFITTSTTIVTFSLFLFVIIGFWRYIYFWLVVISCPLCAWFWFGILYSFRCPVIQYGSTIVLFFLGHVQLMSSTHSLLLDYKPRPQTIAIYSCVTSRSLPHTSVISYKLWSWKEYCYATILRVIYSVMFPFAIIIQYRSLCRYYSGIRTGGKHVLKINWFTRSERWVCLCN